MAKEKPYSRLTHRFVQSVATEGRYGDGRGGLGLSLLVKRTKNGRWSKTWSQRLRIRNKIAMIGLGSFPAVTLALARDKALAHARRVEQGEDIRTPPPQPPPIPTVNAAFDMVIEDRKASWEGEQTLNNWLRMQRLCKPIGGRPVSELKPQEVLDLITPLWHTQPDNARSVRSKLSIVMDWSITKGYRRDSNPARPNVTQSLGKQAEQTHHKSLAPAELGRALAAIRDADVWWATKCALIFIAFTGVRSGEGRRATWDEIDLDTDTWTIPAPRMKARKQHRVPLTPPVKEILAYAREHGESKHNVIFPPELGGQYMPSGNLSRLMKHLKIPAVPHGSRASFTNWAAGCAHIPEAAADMVLAHSPSDEVRKAYRTADFFEHRIPIMGEWGSFLTAIMGPVISTPQALEIPEGLLPEQPANRRAPQTLSQQRRRSDRIAQRICVDAGSDNHETAPGKTRCDACAEVHRVGRRKGDTARRERKKSELALSRAMDKNTAAAQ